jgi:hypothetical protein
LAAVKRYVRLRQSSVVVLKFAAVDPACRGAVAEPFRFRRAAEEFPVFPVFPVVR